jgi:hypothetical protein
MDIETIYRRFRRAQSIAKGTGYRLPNNFESHLIKMTDSNRAALYKITDHFNTKWNNVDPELYFNSGFELYPNFTYTKFFDPRILKLYIHKDKALKRDKDLTKKSLIKSVSFVKKFMAINHIKSFTVYCFSSHENKHLPVLHYLSNDVDGYFITWLLYSQLLHLSEDEKALVPYVIKKYRENVGKLLNINDFLKKLREKL